MISRDVALQHLYRIFSTFMGSNFPQSSNIEAGLSYLFFSETINKYIPIKNIELLKLGFTHRQHNYSHWDVMLQSQTIGKS